MTRSAWQLATRSRPAPPLVLAAWAILSCAIVRADGSKTREQALADAFPEATIERRSAVLTQDQEGRVESAAGCRSASRLATWYRASVAGRLVGMAWFDSHVVRTQPEVLMVVISPEGIVRRVDVLAFREPREYRAQPKWIQQLVGRGLDAELELKRGIRGITGATLTSRAMTRSVRLCLALQQVLDPPVSPTTSAVVPTSGDDAAKPAVSGGGSRP